MAWRPIHFRRLPDAKCGDERITRATRRNSFGDGGTCADSAAAAHKRGTTRGEYPSALHVRRRTHVRRVRHAHDAERRLLQV